MLARSVSVCFLLLILATSTHGGLESRLPATGSTDALARLLRDYVVQHYPTSYEKLYNWGHTRSVATGLKWTGKGLDSQARIAHGERNDGIWRKVRLTVIDPATTLKLDIRNVQQPEPGRTTFDIALSCNARVDYERQRWKAGLRLYSATARARMRITVSLNCELTSQVEWQNKLLPELVFRVHVLRANLSYDGFVLEHVAGIGGDGAKMIGDAVLDAIRQWHPSLERNLLAKADAAIEKAGSNKEIHVGLSKLIKSKPSAAAASPPAAPKKN